jgi:hypothetical protein
MGNFTVVRIALASAVTAALCWALAAPGLAAAHPPCTIVGTRGSDVLHGTPGADVICGRGGNDTIIGGGGNDVLVGGAGEDTLEGGPGNDMLLGGAGADTLKGGSGRNLLRGGAGRNQCFGGIERGCEVPRAKGQGVEYPARAPRLGEEAHPCVEAWCHPQVEPQRDEQAPEFWFLEMGRSADIENGAATISFRADAWDNVGVTKATINLTAPDGSPWKSVPLTARDEFDSVGSVEVPQRSASTQSKASNSKTPPATRRGSIAPNWSPGSTKPNSPSTKAPTPKRRRSRASRSRPGRPPPAPGRSTSGSTWEPPTRAPVSSGRGSR